MNRQTVIARAKDWRYGFQKGQDYQLEIDFNFVRDVMSGANWQFNSLAEFFDLFQVLDQKPQAQNHFPIL